MEKLKDIIRNNNMSTRPEFYSGRGAITCDLNGKILEGIFQGINKEFGEKAAKNFVKMVEDIKVISATTFLTELYALFNNDWKYRKKPKNKQASGIAVQKDKNGNYDEMHGMISMFSAITNGDRDEIIQIKSRFLLNHGCKSEKIYDPDRGIISYYF